MIDKQLLDLIAARNKALNAATKITDVSFEFTAYPDENRLCIEWTTSRFGTCGIRINLFDENDLELVDRLVANILDGCQHERLIENQGDDQ